MAAWGNVAWLVHSLNVVAGQQSTAPPAHVRVRSCANTRE